MGALEDKQKEYHQLHAPAMRAMEYLKSQEREHENRLTLFRIRSIIGTSTQMTREEALISVGRIQAVMEDWFKPEMDIVKFESVKNSLAQAGKLGTVA